MIQYLVNHIFTAVVLCGKKCVRVIPLLCDLFWSKIMFIFSFRCVCVFFLNVGCLFLFFIFLLSICPQSWCPLPRFRRRCKRWCRTWKWLTGGWSGSSVTLSSSRAGASSSPKATSSTRTGRAPSSQTDAWMKLIPPGFFYPPTQSYSSEEWKLPVSKSWSSCFNLPDRVTSSMFFVILFQQIRSQWDQETKRLLCKKLLK